MIRLLIYKLNLVRVVIIQNRICLFPEEQLEGRSSRLLAGMQDTVPDRRAKVLGSRMGTALRVCETWQAHQRGLQASCREHYTQCIMEHQCLLSRPVPLLCATNMHEGRRVRQPASLSRCRPETSIVVCTMRTQTTSPRTTPRTCTLWRLHSAMAPNNLSVRRQALGATTSPGLGPMGRACAVLALASLTGLSHALSCISLHVHERTGPTPRHSPGHQE